MGQICLLPLARSAEARKNPELSPARHRLRQAIAILETALRELETAAAPVARLDAVLAEANQLKRKASAASSRKRSRARSMGRRMERRARPQPSGPRVWPVRARHHPGPRSRPL